MLEFRDVLVPRSKNWLRKFIKHNAEHAVPLIGDVQRLSDVGSSRVLDGLSLQGCGSQ